jgi:hypothetical protein
MVATIFPLTSNAATPDSSENISTIEDESVIYLNSDEELQAFEQALEEHNALVEEKWQEALSQSKEKELSKNSLRALATTYYSKTATLDYSWYKLLGNDYFTGYLTLIGSTYTTSGTKYFSSISDVTFASSKTQNTVEDFSYDTALIDSSRTCAVNFSSYVTVYVSSTSSNRYPVSNYVEYYASGSYLIY